MTAEEGVSLEDVEDVFAFGEWIADRMFRTQTRVSIDDARLEAVALIYELHETWDPKRCPRFSAYLLSLLSRRLTNWYRRELRQSGQGTYAGSRNEYVYYRTCSFSDGAADQPVFDRTF